MNEPKDIDGTFLKRRRQLLKLGAAGMPMLLTMKASATQPVHSALDCAITIPDGLCIMVGSDGAAWVSTTYTYDGQKLTNGKVNQFKKDSQYILPAGAVPDRYRPSGDCPTDPCSSGGGDDDESGHHSSSHDSYLSSLLDTLTLTRPAQASDWGSHDDDEDNSGCSTSSGDDDEHNNSWGSHDSDDNHDDDEGGKSGGTDTADCMYKIYCFDSATTYQPGTFLDSSGNWNLTGDLGLYTIVVAKYAEYYGTQNNFPGVSCLLSIMTYLNQN